MLVVTLDSLQNVSNICCLCSTGGWAPTGFARTAPFRVVISQKKKDEAQTLHDTKAKTTKWRRQADSVLPMDFRRAAPPHSRPLTNNGDVFFPVFHQASAQRDSRGRMAGWVVAKKKRWMEVLQTPRRPKKTRWGKQTDVKRSQNIFGSVLRPMHKSFQPHRPWMAALLNASCWRLQPGGQKFNLSGENVQFNLKTSIST